MPSKYIERLCVLPLETVLPLIRLTSKRHREHFEVIDGHKVKFSGSRLMTFKRHGVVCVSCGLAGSFFAVERDIRDKECNFHLNLYCFRDKNAEAMMTSDHIVPLARGGSRSSLSNRQPMCSKCNNKKQDKLAGELLSPREESERRYKREKLQRKLQEIQDRLETVQREFESFNMNFSTREAEIV